MYKSKTVHLSHATKLFLRIWVFKIRVNLTFPPCFSVTSFSVLKISWEGSPLKLTIFGYPFIQLPYLLTVCKLPVPKEAKWNTWQELPPSLFRSCQEVRFLPVEDVTAINTSQGSLGLWWAGFRAHFRKSKCSCSSPPQNHWGKKKYNGLCTANIPLHYDIQEHDFTGIQDVGYAVDSW